MSKTNPRYASNPYKTLTNATQATIFHPDEYTLAKLCDLPADALRVLIVLAAKYNPATGRAKVSTMEFRPFIARHSSNVRRVVAVLIENDLVTRAKGAHEYYLNPKAFKTISIEL